ncbi:MAG TPA: hypothetical protein PLD54_02765 [Candidatus Levybacteria bacterium]|nr:hypothetical protein [Candidatus Levybacteria bacterium]
MKTVEIYQLSDQGEQKVIAVCSLTEETVLCEGDESFVNHLSQNGITDYSQTPRITIFPDAGLHFLEQMKNNFSSGYINASDILDNSEQDEKKMLENE